MSARENILQRIRAQSGRQGETNDAERAAAREHIAKHARSPLPSIAQGDPVTGFIAECARVKTSVEQVASLQAVPQAAARYLSENALQMHAVGWSALASLDWQGAGIDFEDRLANKDDLVGITDCFCAIGETGTLLLLSSPTTPKLHALLPETHICVVSRARIVTCMEDAFGLLRKERGELPRATFFVSGPSRTADIEQTIVIGAHGPYRVHVLLVP
ncbi:MAG: lactate utilization protein C [Rhodocyclaceae bacterium]|nr:lactate utilization protein C [Rhodocyclaceae bacterium]